MQSNEPPADVRAAIFDLLYCIRPAIWGVEDEPDGNSIEGVEKRIGGAITGWLAASRPHKNGGETLIYDALTRLLFTLSSEEIRAIRGIRGDEERLWLIRHGRADLVKLAENAARAPKEPGAIQ